jgi:anthranilate phosphoribosyltransferase
LLLWGAVFGDKICGRTKRTSLLGTPASGKAHACISGAAAQMIHEALQKIVAEEDLSRVEAEAAMEEILSGLANDAQIAALLTALRMKGETVDELVGFATAMRRHATPIFPGTLPLAIESLVDTCGTGGDASGTFNVSTAAAFVVSGAGVHVAKHGNRSISSRCGSADVLEHLGVRIDLPPERVAKSIEEVGIGFLFAPAIHLATKYAMPARRSLRMRTVFNLLGPLTNPAGASAQVVGVYEPGLTELMARALGELRVRRAFVVHGADHLDEISIAGITYIAELRDSLVRSYTVAPEDFGLRRAPLEAIRGGDAAQNAKIIHRILGRQPASRDHGPHRDIVLANAAAALVASGRAADLLDGVRLAAHSIDSGAARAKLAALIAFSQSEKAHGLAAN